MKRQDNIIPLDADIIQCKAELKEFREKLSGKDSSKNAQFGKLKDLEIIEVAPLEKKSIKQKKQALDSLESRGKSAKIEEESQRAIRKKIQKNLSRPEEVANTNNIPTFDLSKQILADKRSRVSLKRKKPTAKPAKDSTQEKRGIESVVEQTITTNLEKISGDIEQNVTQEIASTPKVELEENLSILREEINAAIAQNSDIAEEDETRLEENDGNLFMLSANEILEKSRITQEEADMLSQRPKEAPLEEASPVADASSDEIAYTLAEEIKQASKNMEATRYEDAAPNTKAGRFSYFSQEPDLIDKTIAEIVRADINSMRQSLLNRGSRIVRYAV